MNDYIKVRSVAYLRELAQVGDSDKDCLAAGWAANEIEQLQADLETTRKMVRADRKLFKDDAKIIKLMRNTIKLIIGRHSNVVWHEVAESDVDGWIREAAGLTAAEAAGGR